MKVKYLIALLCAVTVFSFTSCSNKETKGEEKQAAETATAAETDAETEETKEEQSEIESGVYLFTDDLDREVSLDNPERVVTLMGSFAEIWLLAGGEETLVGTSSDVTDKRELGIPEYVENVGSYENPDMEKLISLDPDLVVLSSQTVRTDSHVSLQESLDSMGIPAAYFDVTHFEDYLHMLDICTDITKDKEAYEVNGLQVEEKIQEIIGSTTVEEGTDYLLLITFSGGIRPQNSDTMTGRMLTELGAHNIIDDYPSLLQDFSLEKVIEADPDYIFVIAMGNDDEAIKKNLEESIVSNPVWSSLSAVKNEQYIILPREQFLYKPNNKWADSYQYLSDIFTKNDQIESTQANGN